MKKLIVTAMLLTGLILSGFAQTMQDTVFNYYTSIPVTIDGQANEDCWLVDDWRPIEQVWIPYNASMSPGDFEGKFKVSWDENYLYLLVEVVDNMLSDDHSDILQNWWDDDCLEVFIDEDRSGGDHERNNNAFAYHVSLFYDAIDLNSSGKGVNYKENLEVVMDTIGENTYLWELAIKMYDASFSPANPEASRVLLEDGKLMGFSLAYCDNDESSLRENFIGFMKMPSSNANDSYKNADYFGPMLLKKTNNTRLREFKKDMDVDIFPIPANEILNIRLNQTNSGYKELSLYSMDGKLIKSIRINESFIRVDTEPLLKGSYMIRIRDGEKIHTQIISKQ